MDQFHRLVMRHHNLDIYFLCTGSASQKSAKTSNPFMEEPIDQIQLGPNVSMDIEIRVLVLGPLYATVIAAIRDRALINFYLRISSK